LSNLCIELCLPRIEIKTALDKPDPCGYQPVLVEWDDEPFARKQFIVWTADPSGAGAFALEWLDYVEQVGLSADTNVRTVRA